MKYVITNSVGEILSFGITSNIENFEGLGETESVVETEALEMEMDITHKVANGKVEKRSESDILKVRKENKIE